MDSAKLGENKKDQFCGFLLEEYRNIAQAHFKSIEATSTFFRYFLLKMTITLSSSANIP
jgi:hypothetical protein